MTTFVPNPKLVADTIAELRARRPDGGYNTPDDIRFLVTEKKWTCRQGGNAFIFWQAVIDAL
jgi:hypothetical protein